MWTFRYKYLIWAFIIFIIEVLIAVFVNDTIIRPHIGDVLVVILIYCVLKTFLNLSVWSAATITLCFSFLVETLQYFRFVEWIGLEKYSLARAVIGTTFSWIDILCYLAGIAIVLFVEKGRHKS
ncbi:MAG: DUF2809 domain-containing protein [Gemmatimonadaceae bacterium]|nr:DUF2809 domain-containing protein [Chitinophagaceae bacterium]